MCKYEQLLAIIGKIISQNQKERKLFSKHLPFRYEYLENYNSLFLFE